MDNKFVDDLSTWCSAHEHSQYINLLQEIDDQNKIHVKERPVVAGEVL